MTTISQFIGKIVHKSELFTANDTWTFPDDIVKDGSGDSTILLTAIGGGGGGGSSGTNATGGYSGECVQRIPKTASGNLSITIGGGGAGSASGDGTAGSNTVVGSWTFSGGDGGWNDEFPDVDPVAYGALPGRNGSQLPGDAGDIRHTYPPMSGPFGGNTGMGMPGGAGGIILDASGKRGANVASGGPGEQYGGGGMGYGGGGGGSSNSTTGGDGADGAVLIEWWEYH